MSSPWFMRPADCPVDYETLPNPAEQRTPATHRGSPAESLSRDL
jgi:hypothetical protein